LEEAKKITPTKLAAASQTSTAVKSQIEKQQKSV
jgi:hypothetical protein